MIAVELLIFCAGLIMGTATSILAKMMYDVESTDSEGNLRQFEKPLFATFVMFAAMALALPLYFIINWYNKRDVASPKDGDVTRSPLIGGGSVTEPPMVIPTKTWFLLIIPSIFDLLATALSGYGLMYTTVSVYQLVRCSVMIVTAILKEFVTDKPLHSYQWMGVFVNTIAMGLVASTSFIHAKTEELDRDPRIGIVFILASCLVQGSQYVFEEKVMTVDNAPPLVVVGMEGIWGVILMIGVVFPIAAFHNGSDLGCLENTYDTLIMVQNSGLLQWMIVLFAAAVFFYNVFCVYVTYLLSSVWHAILDNFRPITVWATSLALYYVFTDGAFGETWGVWCWLEFAGMIVLLIGTAIYNASITLPCFDYAYEAYSDDVPPAQQGGNPVLHSAFGVSSPMINKRVVASPSVYSPIDSHNNGSINAGGKPRKAQSSRARTYSTDV